MKKLNANLIEVPIHFRDRNKGKSKIPKLQIFISQRMPINKPIPDSVLNYWKKVFQDFQAKFSGPKKSV